MSITSEEQKKEVVQKDSRKRATSQVTVKSQERKMLVSKCPHCGSYNYHDCGIEASCINRYMRARTTCSAKALIGVDGKAGATYFCIPEIKGQRNEKKDINNKSKYSFGQHVVAVFPMTRKGSAKAKNMVTRMNRLMIRRSEFNYDIKQPMEDERRRLCDAATYANRWPQHKLENNEVPKPIELGDRFRAEVGGGN